MTDTTLDEAAKVIAALRSVPADMRLDALAITCRMWCDLNDNEQWWPKENR